MSQLIVAGFHRSGTSLLTQLLHRAGLFVGDELLDANASNPYGHFEDREVVLQHDRLLAEAGTNWMVAEPFIPFVARDEWQRLQQFAMEREARHRLWGFKDPRVCLFLPIWKHVLPEAKVIVLYRHFAESSYSLERRHSRELFSGLGRAEVHRRFWETPDLALRMWVEHNRGLVSFAKAYPDDTLVLSFDQLAAGYPLVHDLNASWGLGLAPVETGDVFDPSVTAGRPTRQPLSSAATGERAVEVLRELEALGRDSLRRRGRIDDATR